ncbi:zinc finger, C3HC4 type, partial [Ostertagia ostertagi]
MAIKSELGSASNPIILGLSPTGRATRGKRKVFCNTAVQVGESDPVQSTADERESRQESDPCAVWILSNLEPLLSCSICTEIFYKAVNVVPCGHNFCLSCLMQSLVLTENAHCPQCREEIKDVGLDYTINSIVDVFLEQNPGKIRPLDELKLLDDKFMEAVMALKRMERKRLRVVDRNIWGAPQQRTRAPSRERTREVLRRNIPASVNA